MLCLTDCKKIEKSPRNTNFMPSYDLFLHISYLQISIGYYPCVHYFIWILPLWALLLSSITHYDITCPQGWRPADSWNIPTQKQITWSLTCPCCNTVCCMILLYNDTLWVVMNMLCFVSFLFMVCWNLNMPRVEIYTFSVNLVLMVCWNLCIPYGKNWNLHIAWLFRWIWGEFEQKMWGVIV